MSWAKQTQSLSDRAQNAFLVAPVNPLLLWQTPALAALAPAVVHGFSGTMGGESQTPFASLNVGGAVGDDPPVVERNRHRLMAELGLGSHAWRGMRQVHGSNIHRIDKVDEQPDSAIEADALLTDQRGIALAVVVADCVPLLLADQKGQAIAVAHLGWRGTQAHLAHKTAAALRSAFALKPDTLVAALGPAIGPCCFVVANEVAQGLATAYPRMRSKAFVAHADKQRQHVDLWALNESDLLEAGLAQAHITSVRRCTFCSNKLFSYRRQFGKCGRQAGLVALSDFS